MQLECCDKGNASITKSKQVFCCSFQTLSGEVGRTESRNRNASKQSEKQDFELRALNLLGLVNLFPRILKNKGIYLQRVLMNPLTTKMILHLSTEG